MLSKDSPKIFQNNMPGNVCFGCGRETKDGLHVKVFGMVMSLYVFGSLNHFIKAGRIL